MDEKESVAGAGYGLAAITLQMALLNSLAGKGNVPDAAIKELVSRAKQAIELMAAPEFSSEVIRAALDAMERVEMHWKTMVAEKRH
jgi:hypothetical protein